jgi:hypothetical protein
MPDLTPEERQRIYEEEKARIEARDNILRPKRQKRIAAIILSSVGVTVAVAALAGIFGSSAFWDAVYSVMDLPSVESRHGASSSTPPHTAARPPSAQQITSAYANYHTVTYDAEGGGYVNFTYTNETGGSEQTFSHLPWKKTFTARSGQTVYVSGQIDGDGALILEIYLDGAPVQKAETYTQYGVATVGGKVP